MTQSEGFALPEHVADKIAKVLGVSASELNGYDLVKLIEELCDTALMFDREERGAGHTPQPNLAGEIADPEPKTRHTRYVPHGSSGGPGFRRS